MRWAFLRNRLTLYISWVTALLIGAMFLSHVGATRVAIWVGGVSLVVGVRMLQTRHFLRLPQPVSDSRQWGRRYQIMLTLDGLLWGLSLAWFAPSGSDILDNALRCTLIGAAALGTFVSLSQPRASLTFLLAVLGPPMITEWRLNSFGIPWVVIGLYGCFSLTMAFEARRASLQIHELLRLRLHTAEIAEQQQQALDLAERSNAAKSRFLATVSHELRTPLNGILGMGQLLGVAGLTPAQQEQLHTMLQSARHLRTVIDDILDMARIEAGRMALNPVTFDLHRTVADVVNVLQPLAEAKGLRFECRIEPGLPTHWLGDAGRVRQVLHNLVGNAIKFTEKGHVRLSVSMVPEGVQCVVVDSGVGISPQALPRIFEPFEQTHALSAEGTGLGLPIARQLARMMGGDVTVLSSRAGSAFTFTFRCRPVAAPTGAQGPRPAAVPPAQASVSATGLPADEPAATQPTATGRRVLVVEDNRINAIVACAMLERMGIHHTLAGDGTEALALLADEPFDLVLMDCQMPGMNGLEAVRLWRMQEAREQRPRTRIIAVTANAAQGDRDECLAAGMDDHLPKPFEMQALEQMVRRHLGLD